MMIPSATSQTRTTQLATHTFQPSRPPINPPPCHPPSPEYHNQRGTDKFLTQMQVVIEDEKLNLSKGIQTTTHSFFCVIGGMPPINCGLTIFSMMGIEAYLYYIIKGILYVLVFYYHQPEIMSHLACHPRLCLGGCVIGILFCCKEQFY